jgi:short-subunit dehydrogenase involved in D-alanine esterification of teichoic acids
LNKNFENLRRKSQIEILEIKSPYSQTKSTVEGHSSRLEQIEERISELEDKIKIKGKTEEILSNRSRAVKGISKNSVTPSKDQI